jgi:hypothetical protein
MCLISSSSLFVWEFAKRHPGIMLVLVGVFGEGFEIFSKIFCKSWAKKHELGLEIVGAFCWMVVVTGLAFEIPDAANTDKDAADARLETAKLELKIQWRTITPQQRETIEHVLGKNPQAGRVIVRCEPTDPEACAFGTKICDVLNECFFNANFNPAVSVYGWPAPSGLIVLVSDTNNPPQKSELIRKAFGEVGFPMVELPNAPARHPEPDNIVIIVGTKP